MEVRIFLSFQKVKKNTSSQNSKRKTQPCCEREKFSKIVQNKILYSHRIHTDERGFLVLLSAENTGRRFLEY